MRSPPTTRKRCSWVNEIDLLLLEYHDKEWGVPAHNDRRHFEILVLSGAQAGLNWSLVLKKRDGYRRAFDKFDPEKVARYSDKRIQTLIANPEIIRNRMKIEAAVTNAFAKNSAVLIPIAGDSSTGGPSSTAGGPPHRSRRLLPNPRHSARI